MPLHCLVAYRPERWLDEAYINALHPMAYQPFGKGPQNCIGQTFALLEAKVLIAMMYARFTFRCADAGVYQVLCDTVNADACSAHVCWA